MTHYRHLIWDWNGTLLDDAWLGVEILNGMLARRGMAAVTAQAYAAAFGFPVRAYYAAVGFDFTREPFDVLAAEFVDAYHRRRFECALQPGARQVLETLTARGYTHSVLSAYEQTALVEMIAHHDMDDIFTHLVGMHNHHADGKVANGLRFIATLGCQPAETLLIGDTLHDHEVATAIGAHCILIPSGHQSFERLAACGARVVEKIADVLRVL